MRCQCCSADNPESDLRCRRCQRRLHIARPRSRPESYPIVAAAVAPELTERPKKTTAAGPRLAAVNSGYAGPTPAWQQSLFPHGPGGRITPLGGGRRRASGSRRKRVVSPNQTSFDFAPPPATDPLLRELDLRKAPLPVAPRSLRAVAAVLDAMVVCAFAGIFLLTLQMMSRYVLDQSIFVRETIPYLAAAPVLFGFLYRFLFTVYGRTSLGAQLTGLTLVSFDGCMPTPGQRLMRMFGGWVSLCSAAMWLIWALADQETLTWHDHISQTLLTAAPVSGN